MSLFHFIYSLKDYWFVLWTSSTVSCPLFVISCPFLIILLLYYWMHGMLLPYVWSGLPFLSFLSYLFHTEFNSKEFISYILVFIGFLCPVISSLDTIYLLIIGTKTYIISFIFLELYFSFKSKFISRFISRFYFILSFSLWYQDLSLGSHLTFSRLLFHKDNYRHLPQFLDIFCYL